MLQVQLGSTAAGSPMWHVLTYTFHGHSKRRADLQLLLFCLLTRRLLPYLPAAPEARTSNIDAALAAGRNRSASTAELQAASAEIIAGWHAKRGFHKRIFGVQTDSARKHISAHAIAFALCTCSPVSKPQFGCHMHTQSMGAAGPFALVSNEIK